MSNENDRGMLQENPGWLELSDRGIREGRMRAAVDGYGAITGFATYSLSGGLAELEDLFVDPLLMRRGIATALVLDICTRLYDLGFDTLEVTANPHAMAFYKRLRFVEVQTVDTAGYPAPRMSRLLGH